MQYKEAWQFLDDLQFFKIKLGLDSMQGFLQSLGQPQERVKFVHIAGTNGKGSTAVTLLSILTEAGYKVGLYTSPHLSSVRERFRINNAYISEEDFARLADRIITVLQGRQITYFEFATTLALLWFKEQQVDLAILEVGMGGRLDATNVIDPLLTIITNVSMDHEAYLGDTLAKVAYEKAGIIKKGVPLLTAAAADDSRTVIAERAAEMAAPLYLLGDDFSYCRHGNGRWDYRGTVPEWQLSELPCGLSGEHQLENASLALAAVEFLSRTGFPVPETAVRQGLLQVRWPGRLEYVIVDAEKGTSFVGNAAAVSAGEQAAGPKQKGVHYLLDGAHNPAGVATLKKTLQQEIKRRPLVAVWASMADKDIEKSLLPVAPLFDHIVLTRPESERSAKPADLQKMLPTGIKACVHCTDSVAAAMEEAGKLAGDEGLVCVAGSLYLVGAARKILLGELVP